MLKIYKKCEKNINNPSGIIEVQELNEINKPFLLCLSAQENYDQSIYGIMRFGAETARVNTTQGNAAGFKIDEMPVSFLGVRFISDTEYNNIANELVDKFIYPYLKMYGNDIETVSKQTKKMNFMTYCDGTITYKDIEQRLQEKLKEEGLKDNEVENILSQISLTAIGTMVDIDMLHALTTTFIDVNDSEIFSSITPHYKKILADKQTKSFCGITKDRQNHSIYIYEGTGNHSLKEYLKDGVIVKPVLCSVVSSLLEQSISPSITKKSVVPTLQKYAIEGKLPQELLEELDKNLSYQNTPRYSTKEALLRSELNIAYKELFNTRKKLDSEKKNSERNLGKLNILKDKIQEYSSETTYLQILTSAKLWQAPKEIFNEPSDKQIREEYNSQYSRK